MYIFTFSVIIEGLNTDEYRKEYGAGLANSYSHAAKTIEERYGTDLISIANLTIIDTDTIIPLPKSIVEDYITFDEYRDWAITCDVTGKENMPNEH